MAGLGSAVGVLLGGLLTQGPGWRWVFLVNPPLCAVVLAGAFMLLSGDRRRGRLVHFDILGALLGTAGALLLVYTLVRAPAVGWGSARTIGELAGAAALLAAFVVNEQRSENPLLPLSIFRIKGLAAADITQLIAIAGMFAVFFFLTLYLQGILGYSPIRTGLAYLPVTVGVGLSAGMTPRLIGRVGTRPVIVAGTLVAAGGVFWLAQVPVHGSYLDRPAARADDHVGRARSRVRRRRHRRQRRRAAAVGRTGRRAVQRVTVGSAARWGWPSSPPSRPAAPPTCSPPAPHRRPPSTRASTRP